MVIDEGRGAHSGATRNSDAYNDEISLYDLVLILWRNKVVGIIVAVVVMALTLGYLFIATPVYKADAHFLPPLQQDIEALNVAKQYGLLGYSTERVYEEFIRQLNSLALRRKFYDRNNLSAYYMTDNKEANPNVVFNEAFNEKLIVSTPGRDEDSPFRTISFEIDAAEEVASLLNQFVEFVISETKEQLIGNVRNSIVAEIDTLERLITSKRDIAERRRLDELAELEEALQIAKKLKIQKLSDSPEYEARNQLADPVLNTVPLPLYTRGTIALEAEIESLKNRKSDDPFIAGLRDTQERANTLRALVINPQKVKVVTIDSPAYVPNAPEKPKKLLVLAVGMCLALLLGVMAAFFAEFVKGLRRQFKSLSNEG